jgi:hypothetical protein
MHDALEVLGIILDAVTRIGIVIDNDTNDDKNFRMRCLRTG